MLPVLYVYALCCERMRLPSSFVNLNVNDGTSNGVAVLLTFVGELGHAVQISQGRRSVLLFVVDQQIHLRLCQELGHPPSAPAGSFLGRRRQWLTVLVFIFHNRREDWRSPSETSLHGVVHSVKPGPRARVRLHASSRELQLLVDTTNISPLVKAATTTDS